MRIRVKIKDQIINISNIKISNKRLIFTCHKRYERVVFSLGRNTLTFIDNRGKELFRSSWIRTYRRFYEEDWRVRKPKVEMVADDIMLEDIGYVSNHYLEKIVDGACNSCWYSPPVKKVKQPIVDQKPLTKEEKAMDRKLMQVYYRWCATRRYAEYYKKTFKVLRYTTPVLKEFNIMQSIWKPPRCVNVLT